MTAPTHILFDFFGTLVSYSESRTEQGFGDSYQLLRALGASVTYPEFLAGWDHTFEAFERQALGTLDEYSMDAVCTEYLRRVLPGAPDLDAVARFRDGYLAEWSEGVTGVPGVKELLARLSRRHVLVLVTNTHHAALVHGQLQAMNIGRYFARVITSVEHGRRKPSACIFGRALTATRGSGAAAIHVGDSFAADYRGATSAGLRALLIDPERRFDVPEHDRLIHILDLEERLGSDGAVGKDA